MHVLGVLTWVNLNIHISEACKLKDLVTLICGKSKLAGLLLKVHLSPARVSEECFQ